MSIAGQLRRVILMPGLSDLSNIMPDVSGSLLLGVDLLLDLLGRDIEILCEDGTAFDPVRLVAMPRRIENSRGNPMQSNTSVTDYDVYARGRIGISKGDKFSWDSEHGEPNMNVVAVSVFTPGGLGFTHALAEEM